MIWGCKESTRIGAEPRVEPQLESIKIRAKNGNINPHRWDPRFIASCLSRLALFCSRMKETCRRNCAAPKSLQLPAIRPSCCSLCGVHFVDCPSVTLWHTAPSPSTLPSFAAIIDITRGIRLYPDVRASKCHRTLKTSFPVHDLRVLI
jgi:hypothetical protein